MHDNPFLRRIVTSLIVVSDVLLCIGCDNWSWRIPSTKLAPSQEATADPTPSPSPTAELAISDGATYDFGSVTVGNVSNKTFTVTNSSGASATNLSSTLTGSGFTFVGGSYPGGGSCSTTLAAGSNCTVVARFAPTGSGTGSDTLSISYHNATTTTAATRSLTGTGLSVATLSLSGASPFDFGSVASGSSFDNSFTLSNGGETLASGISGDAFGSADFLFPGGTFPGGGSCGSNLSPSSSCTVVVRLSPGSAGAKSDTLSIPYNDGANTTSVTRAVQGTGTVLGQSGALDTTFHTDGKAVNDLTGASDYLYGMSGYSDGKLITAGASASSEELVSRYLTNGGLDTSFHTDGIFTHASSLMAARDVVVQTDGKALVATAPVTAAAAADSRIFRLNEGGDLDTAFSTDGMVSAFSGLTVCCNASVILSTGGKFYTNTIYATLGAISGPNVSRFHSNGVLDTSFKTSGFLTWAGLGTGPTSGSIGRMKLFDDGSLAVIGWGNGAGVDRTYFSKIRTSGTLDTAFHTDGMLTTTLVTQGYSLAIDNSSRLLAIGSKAGGGGMARFLSMGEIDTSFSTDGTNVVFVTNVYDGLASGDKIILSGHGPAGMAVARLMSDSSLDTSFATNGSQTTLGFNANEAGQAVTRRPDNGDFCVAGYKLSFSETDIACFNP